MKKVALIVLLIAVLLWGCRRQDTTVQSNVVTQITITCQTNEELIERRYTSQEKMRSVLLYIRSVNSPFSAPEAPTEEAGEYVSITTVRADKSIKTYSQQGFGFFREGEENWKIIDPEKGANL